MSYQSYSPFFDPRFYTLGSVDYHSADYLYFPPPPNQSFGSLYVPPQTNSNMLYVPIQIPVTYVNDPNFEPVGLTPKVPTPKVKTIKHRNGIPNYIPQNKKIVIDFFNILHSNRRYLDGEVLFKGNLEQAVAPIIKIICDLLKYENSVMVVMHNKYLHLTKLMAELIKSKFPNAKDKLRIFAYIGPQGIQKGPAPNGNGNGSVRIKPEESGDDLIMLKLAKKYEAIIISNDNFDKFKDRSFVPEDHIREYL